MEDALGGTECILSKKNLNNGVKRILQVCETPAVLARIDPSARTPSRQSHSSQTGHSLFAMIATSLNPARSPLLSLFAALFLIGAFSLLPALQHNLVGDGPPRAKRLSSWLELPELLGSIFGVPNPELTTDGKGDGPVAAARSFSGFSRMRPYAPFNWSSHVTNDWITWDEDKTTWFDPDSGRPLRFPYLEQGSNDHPLNRDAATHFHPNLQATEVPCVHPPSNLTYNGGASSFLGQKRGQWGRGGTFYCEEICRLVPAAVEYGFNFVELATVDTLGFIDDDRLFSTVDQNHV